MLSRPPRRLARSMNAHRLLAPDVDQVRDLLHLQVTVEPVRAEQVPVPLLHAHDRRVDLDVLAVPHGARDDVPVRRDAGLVGERSPA